MSVQGNKQWVGEGMTMDWVMQGREEEELPFVLQLRFVRLADGREGVILAEHTSVPRGIEVTSLQPEDVTTFHGKMVWLKGMSGLAVMYDGDVYPLFRVEDVAPNTGGTLCFHFLPSELDPTGRGEVAYSDAMVAA